MKKCVVLVFLLLSLAASDFFMFHSVKASSKIITVPDDFPTFQAAIDASPEGNTVFVKKGTYNENLTVNKSLSLVGENKYLTVVLGEGNTALLVQHDNVNVTGFTFRRPSTMRWYYGVHLLNIKHCNVFGNRMESTFYGIWLVDASFNNVYENTLAGDWNGIHLTTSHDNNISKNEVTGSNDWGISTEGSDNNVIMGNYVVANGWAGIGLDGGSPNRNNLIAENTITRNGNIGIEITSNGSSLNKIVGNNITANGSEEGDEGILIAFDSNLVVGNNITGNQAGIRFDASQNNTILQNLIEDNTYGAILIHSPPYREASQNIIYENNIINSQIRLTGNVRANIWDIDSKGNYWSNYTGTDSNGDGVGDIPYTIDIANIDHYPLMNQVNIVVNITEFLPTPSPTPTPLPTPTPTSTPIQSSTNSLTPPPSETPTSSLSSSPTLEPTPTPSPPPLNVGRLHPDFLEQLMNFVLVIIPVAVVIAIVIAVILLRRRSASPVEE